MNNSMTDMLDVTVSINKKETKSLTDSVYSKSNYLSVPCLPCLPPPSQTHTHIHVCTHTDAHTDTVPKFDLINFTFTNDNICTQLCIDFPF